MSYNHYDRTVTIDATNLSQIEQELTGSVNLEPRLANWNTGVEVDKIDFIVEYTIVPVLV